MKGKCNYPGCGKEAYSGTYYIKGGERRWGVFCRKHELDVIRERQVALQEKSYSERRR